MMHKHRMCCRVLMGIALLLLMLVSCGEAGNTSNTETHAPGITASQANGNPAGADTPSPVNNVSTVSFTIAGGATGSYTISSSVPTSKLRHGHREFTIDVARAGKSIVLAFFGYNGPGVYTLSGGTNGGDVRIDFGQGNASWELSLNEYAQCTLTITSDTPTQYAGIDRMKGSFVCPMLLSSDPGVSKRPIAVSNGSIDIFILVES